MKQILITFTAAIMLLSCSNKEIKTTGVKNTSWVCVKDSLDKIRFSDSTFYTHKFIEGLLYDADDVLGKDTKTTFFVIKYGVTDNIIELTYHNKKTAIEFNIKNDTLSLFGKKYYKK